MSTNAIYIIPVSYDTAESFHYAGLNPGPGSRGETEHRHIHWTNVSIKSFSPPSSTESAQAGISIVFAIVRINLCPYASKYWRFKSFILHYYQPIYSLNDYAPPFFLYSYLFYLASAGMLNFLFVRPSLIGQNFVCYCHFVT